MKQVFDLHLHTNNSDGELSVEKLVEEVKKNNIRYFSITDHDNIDSVKEIEKTNIGDLTYLKGVEFSSIFDNKYKLHILGYNFDENNEDIINITKKLKTARTNRFYELANVLHEKYNFSFEKEELDEIINNVNIPGKPHLAKLMIKKGYVNSVPEAFMKYLEDVKTTISNREDAEIVIKAIKKAGGVAIWAHPKKVEKQYNINFEDILFKLVDIGLDGIEIYNSLHSLDDCKRYERVAKQYNLITSGGSDFHGINTKPDVKIGEVFNSGEIYLIDINDIKILKEKN